MKMSAFAFLIGFLLTSNTRGESRTVTLVLRHVSEIAELAVGSNEVAKVVSWPRVSGASAGALVVEKGGVTNTFVQTDWWTGGAHGGFGITIAGPANFTLIGSSPHMCTVEVTPESFPPDKTIVIPEGGGANITMECSTNLIDWAPATLGVYTNQPANKFFRLRAERVP